MKSMATLSVLNYNLPPGLAMKLNNQNSNSSNSVNSLSKTFNKITVQNVLSENNGNSINLAIGNPNAIVRKIKDFGMIGAVNNASGAASLNINPLKRPLTENKKNFKTTENKLLSSANKKPKLTKEERAALRATKKSLKENSNSIVVKEPIALVQPTKIPGTPGRKGLPLPQAVARRNARERNRVKQVNNGFAALRERIPEEVAEAFENQGNKASGKKLSKVETLRMAVEYIRSLERLLGFDFPIGSGHHHNSSSGEESFSLIKDEFDAYSPSIDEQFDDSLSHYDTEEYFNGNSSNQTQIHSTSSPHPTLQQMDMLPNITTLNGLQYIRIPGTNTYQLLTPDIFVGTASSPPSSTIDEEQFNALIDTNCISPSSCSPIRLGCTTSADDLHNATPSSINSLEVIRRVQETAPVLTTTEENIKEGSLISTNTTSSSSLSPVPQSQQQLQQQHQLLPILTTSSPSSSGSGSPLLHQQQHATLSPASTNDPAGSRQTCAANQQQQEFVLPKTTTGQQQIGTLHMIKQEFDEPSIIYQQTSPSQQQQHQQLYQTVHNLTMSPPLDRNTPTTTPSSCTSSSSAILPSFYTHEQNSSFYESVVALKKEFNEVLLNASHSNHSLSDESMIETIDWWDAHTPKSDVGSGML